MSPKTKGFFLLLFQNSHLLSVSWLYGLNLAIDANFRLKLKERGVEDPEFGPGWAYFVEERSYQAEILKHPQPMEVRSLFSRLTNCVIRCWNKKIWMKTMY